MSDKFFIQEKCDRCGSLLTGGRTMSRFDTSCICMSCAKNERKHPDYHKAVEAELDAIKRGNHNFKGIGFRK